MIVVLKSVVSSKQKSGLIGNGQWLNLSDYINETQRLLSKDMGWVNINEIVKFRYVPAMAKNVNESELAKLVQSDLVEAVYPDRFNQFSLENSAKMIGLNQVNHYHTGGKGFAVAVVDSGVEASHPFFSGRVIDGACFSRFGSCEGGRSQALGVQAGEPCNNAKVCMHGTHVAGIVAGSNSAMSGIAPSASIVPINVFSEANGRYGVADSDIMQALEWVYQNHQKHKIAAVNLSVGGGFFTQTCDQIPVKRLIDLLLDKGVITVVAAGNDRKINGVASPACVESAVTVGALDPDGSISNFSNSYYALDMVAPGGNIVSSVPNGGYDKSSGTSMASPQVAGAVVTLKSLFPQAGATEIVQALKQGSAFRDPRNNITTPSLYLPSAINWLAANHSDSAVLPRSNTPKPVMTNCKPQRIDGVLIESASTDCKTESKNSGAIKW